MGETAKSTYKSIRRLRSRAVHPSLTHIIPLSTLFRLRNSRPKGCVGRHGCDCYHQPLAVARPARPRGPPIHSSNGLLAAPRVWVCVQLKDVSNGRVGSDRGSGATSVVCQCATIENWYTTTTHVYTVCDHLTAYLSTSPTGPGPHGHGAVVGSSKTRPHVRVVTTDGVVFQRRLQARWDNDGGLQGVRHTPHGDVGHRYQHVARQGAAHWERQRAPLQRQSSATRQACSHSKRCDRWFWTPLVRQALGVAERGPVLGPPF